MKSFWLVALVNLILWGVITFVCAFAFWFIPAPLKNREVLGSIIAVLLLIIPPIFSGAICSKFILKTKLVFDKLWIFGFITSLYFTVVLLVFLVSLSGPRNIDPVGFLGTLIGGVGLGTLLQVLAIYLGNVIFRIKSRTELDSILSEDVLDSNS